MVRVKSIYGMYTNGIPSVLGEMSLIGSHQMMTSSWTVSYAAIQIFRGCKEIRDEIYIL
jgi:hypothetical protein